MMKIGLVVNDIKTPGGAIAFAGPLRSLEDQDLAFDAAPGQLLFRVLELELTAQ